MTNSENTRIQRKKWAELPYLLLHAWFDDEAYRIAKKFDYGLNYKLFHLQYTHFKSEYYNVLTLGARYSAINKQHAVFAERAAESRKLGLPFIFSITSRRVLIQGLLSLMKSNWTLSLDGTNVLDSEKNIVTDNRNAEVLKLLKFLETRKEQGFNVIVEQRMPHLLKRVPYLKYSQELLEEE